MTSTITDERTVPARARRMGGRHRSDGTPPSERPRPLWMLVPGGVLMTLLILIPLLLAFWISLLDLDQYSIRQWLQAPFVGLGNVIEAFSSSPLLRGIWLSVSYSLIVSVAAIPIGVLAALATQNAFRGRGLIRSVYLIPYILPAFVVATVFRAMFQPEGVVDEAFGLFGITPGLWLNGPQSYWTLVIAQLWVSWPFVYLLTLAGLQAVDPEVHEAAALDGAGWGIKLRRVILPYLRGSILLAFILTFLHNINAFTMPFVLFGIPAPADVQVLPVLTYITAFQSFRFGLSAAMAVASLAIVAVPLFVYLRAVRLDTGEDARR
ncbi:sugar ABC transporter permease [Microbacterium resistens]|uniref:Sugar ABC transporter permease n=1 Tax=Microbacterium resistens TaxID=156977 RepID=A0ABY3RRA7_9MICO|nr:sugar ABC transporter permease [Microbacterium resistens]